LAAAETSAACLAGEAWSVRRSLTKDLPSTKKASRIVSYNTNNQEANMQIKALHKSIYKLYGYARKQEVLDAYREKYQGIVEQ